MYLTPKNQNKVDNIVEDIVLHRSKSFIMDKKTWAGEIFYSDIYNYCKNSFSKKDLPLAHSEICDDLRKANFYIHS
jgi:hypothetical protein